MNIIRRLEELESNMPDDLMVKYRKGQEEIRSTVREYCVECRKDRVMYDFVVVDGNRFTDIDLIIRLIDDIAKGTL